MFYDPNAWLKKLRLKDFLPTNKEIIEYKYKRVLENLSLQLIRKVGSPLVSLSLLSVTPMSAPSGLLFYTEFKNKET